MTPWLPAVRTSLWATSSGSSRRTAAAGPDHELAQAPRLVLAPGRILGPEPLVVVIVAVDDDIRAGPVERVPERPHRGVAAVLAGTEPRVMPDRHRAHGGRRLEVGRQPATLGGLRAAAADEGAVRIEDDHVPRAEVVGVPTLAVRGGPLSEIVEVPGEILGLPVMVPGGGPGPVQVAAPGRRVAVAEVGGAAIRVGVVAGGEDGPLDRVEEFRRRRARIELAIGDVAGTDEDRVARRGWTRGLRWRSRAPGPNRSAPDPCRSPGAWRRDLPPTG